MPATELVLNDFAKKWGCNNMQSQESCMEFLEQLGHVGPFFDESDLRTCLKLLRNKRKLDDMDRSIACVCVLFEADPQAVVIAIE